MPMLKETMLKRLLLPIAAAGGGGSAPVQDTATGNPLTFITDLARPLKSLTIPFLPVQSGTGDPSPENDRPISGMTGLRLVHLDENLLSINRINGQSTQGITYTPIKQGNKTVAIRVQGERTSTNPFFNLNYVDGTTLSIPAGSYKIRGGVAGCRMQVFYKDAGGVERIAGQDYGSGADITIPSDALASWSRLLVDTDSKVDMIVYPVLLSASGTYAEHSIAFPDAVYGGILYMESGVLRITWAEINKKWSDGQSATDMGSGITRKTFPMVDNLSTGSSNNLCNVAPYAANESAVTHFYYSGSGATNRNARVFLPSDTPDSTDITIVTKLAEQQTVQLTPEQITALVGNNTIWSDADGEMTATYLKKG